MFTLVEECMGRVGLHHQTLPGFTRVPLSDTLVVPIPDRQIAFQQVEKLCKWVPMKWNTHTRHNRHLKNGKGAVSYLYTDGEGSHFLDQESFETLTLNADMVGDALEFLVEGVLLQLRKFNGNPIGLQLPIFVELDVAETEPGVKGDSSSGSVTKVAKMETGLEIRVPLFIKQGEKVKIATETREFAGRA